MLTLFPNFFCRITSEVLEVVLKVILKVSFCLWLAFQFLGGTQVVIGEEVSIVNAPEFPADVQWLNVAEPLSLKVLRGRYVLLDFWTYACINCMHVVPDLEKLEHEFSSKLTVIGVHSAKFKNEKDSKQIAKAIERFGIHHPVVNDSEFSIWESYAVKAWPTVVLIDPNGKIILTRSGEGVYDAVHPVLSKVINTEIKKSTKELTTLAPEQLRFPGKLIIDDSRLYISDSGRNRVVVTDLNGRILEIIGSDEAGNQNGKFTETRFNEPLGLAVKGQSLFIADRKNHQIRVCNLELKQCEVLVGSGKQGKEFNLSGRGEQLDLNSPWDLLVDGDFLYVAMAGFHQIWRIDLNSKYAEVFSGTGAEAITDGPRKDLVNGGTHAQPSGITGTKERFFVADSESSSIREIKGDRLSTVIGTGLFDFGDRDGKFSSAKLQHPLAVLLDGESVFVADTFNSKIKRIDLVTKEIETFSGGIAAGYADGKQALFDEPSGLAVKDNELYVADTNNNSIRIIDLKTKDVRTLKLSESSNQRQDLGVIEASSLPGKEQIELTFKIPPGHSLNIEAPNQIRNEQRQIFEVGADRIVNLLPGSYEGEIYYCQDKTKLCLVEKIKFILTRKAGTTVKPELRIGAD